MSIQSFLPPPADVLQARALGAKPLFRARSRSGVTTGVLLHGDPAAEVSGTWQSPAGRFLEIQTHVTKPGAWLALHVKLTLTDMRGLRWIGVAARSSAQQATAVGVCLRSVHASGFHDQFFPRSILSRAAQSDHHDLLDPSQFPDLPQHVKRRELVLFLPPATPVSWALHDLAVFGL